MFKKLAVLALFLGASEAINMRTFMMLEKDGEAAAVVKAEDAAVKADLKSVEKSEKGASGEAKAVDKAEVKDLKSMEKSEAAKENEADAKDTSLKDKAEKLTVEAAKASAKASKAAMDGDPYLPAASREPSQKAYNPFVDRTLTPEDLAVRAAVKKAQEAVANEPKVKAARLKAEMLLPDPLAPDVPMNPMAGTGNASFRKTRVSPVFQLGNPNVQSCAGPDVTDQIGRSVHSSAMAGMEPTPEPRNLIGNDPKSFKPGGVPPIPWPKPEAEKPATVETEKKAPKKETKEEAKASNEKNEEAIAKKTADAVKGDPKDKSDPANDPAVAMEKAELEAPSEKTAAKAEKAVEKKEKAAAAF